MIFSNGQSLSIVLFMGFKVQYDPIKARIKAIRVRRVLIMIHQALVVVDLWSRWREHEFVSPNALDAPARAIRRVLCATPDKIDLPRE